MELLFFLSFLASFPVYQVTDSMCYDIVNIYAACESSNFRILGNWFFRFFNLWYVVITTKANNFVWRKTTDGWSIGTIMSSNLSNLCHVFFLSASLVVEFICWYMKEASQWAFTHLDTVILTNGLVEPWCLLPFCFGSGIHMLVYEGSLPMSLYPSRYYNLNKWIRAISLGKH